MNKYKIQFLMLICITILILNLRLSADNLFVDMSSKDFYQDGSAKYPYAAIQKAIDNSHSDYIIKIAEGIYNESIILPESMGISLLGG